MLEFLKSCAIDFVLFSGIEGFIFCLFFEKICGCRKFKWYEWLLLSIGNCIISKIFIQGLYQIVCIIFMSIIINFINKSHNIKKYITMSCFGFFIFLFTEIPYSMILEYLNITDLILCGNKIKVFCYLFPIKIIEIIICTKGDKIMKILVGGVVRK